MIKKYNFIIPAAGSARRLRPLTDNLPKNLLKINDRAIIDYQLSNIPSENVKNLIVVLGHEAKLIRKHIDKLNLKYPVTYYYNLQYKETNCAFSLMHAVKELAEGFILINCDLLYLKKNIYRLIDSKSHNVITIRSNTETQTDLEQVLIANNKVIKWGLKLPDSNAEVMGPLMMNAENAKKIIEYYQSLNIDIQKKMHCFTLFSNCINDVLFSTLRIEDSDWQEIDSIKDLNDAKQKIRVNKLFQI